MREHDEELRDIIGPNGFVGPYGLNAAGRRLTSRLSLTGPKSELVGESYQKG